MSTFTDAVMNTDEII